MSTQETLARITELVRTLGAISEATATSELVRVGADLWEIRVQVESHVERIKAIIRSREEGAQTQQLLRGPGATCLVTPQPTQVSVRKSVQLSELRRLLGDTFDVLFEVTEQVAPRKGFEAAITHVDDGLQVAAALAAVDIVTHKPRISFHLEGGSKPGSQP